MNNNHKISKSSTILLVIAGLLIASTLILPLWSISLDAPQYPEGLNMKIHSNKLAGDVDIINGLNHYIGMKVLKEEDFPEFIYLPYILGSFAFLTVIVGLIRKRLLVNILLIAFVIFGVLAMYDFWLWEYEYGHDLDPNAAIIVPGMSYQPPLFGSKQLLNFVAHSFPAAGGWLMFLGGILIFIVAFIEGNWKRVFKKSKGAVAALFMVMFMTSCAPDGPEPININRDACEHCKMIISDGRFGAELITQKGRVYKFDDAFCLRLYQKDNPDVAVKSNYIHDFNADNVLIPAESAFYVKNEDIKSPMGGNIAAFSNEADQMKFFEASGGQKLSWEELIK